uniref:Uncharacterized protein n=1 Tax=Oryza brachyantha TaxID=4533 RepID=J3LDU9_ORYBR
MAAAVMSSCDCDDAAVDWRGRPCRPRHHGGMRAAAFALGMVALEMAAVAAVGNNLITYVFGEMHFPLAEAANVVTNFVGAVFLLALLGGFLADSYLGCFPTILAFSLVELAGLVFVAAFTKRKLIRHSSSSNNLAGDGGFRHADKFRFLDKACVRAARRSDGGGDAPSPESPWELCTEADVRQAKTLLAVAPIFACTIVFNTVLAQLQTFSVQQGAAMDTALPGFGFRMPPASLQAIPYAVMLVLVPAYELLLTPLSRRLLGRDAGAVTPLRRVGVGLFTVAFSMLRLQQKAMPWRSLPEN